MLLCTVRGCGLDLAEDGRRMICPQGHSFDVAKSGYLNLLQPQERRSKNPGDSAEAVAARRRLHDRGITAPLLQSIGELAHLNCDDAVLDAGCGEGFYLGSLQSAAKCTAWGVDISTPAIEAAARRYPACKWLVANADRNLPFADGSVTTILSITARMNPAEFYRILRSGGRLLVATAAPDDLIEIREIGKDRRDMVRATFLNGFQLLQEKRVSTTAWLEVTGVEDVRTAIYRPLHAAKAKAMRVTFSLDLSLFRRDENF